MEKQDKIYVAGHKGLVGSAIYRKLLAEGYTNLVVRTSKELDLRNQASVDEFFASEKPAYVFFAAGTVGGIMANKTYPGNFIFDNVIMIFNALEAARKNQVTKFLYLGSSCIYPKDAPQPIKEDYLLTDKLEETNKPYALAKIAGVELCLSYNKQYGTNNICLMPTNMFGINDNYDSQNSHLVAALIRKFYEAKVNKAPHVMLWGTGTPRREVLSADQLADACLFFMQNYSGNDIINIGSGEDITIKDLAQKIKEISGYEGELQFDATKPDGTMKKQLDVSRASGLGWTSNDTLDEDLEKAYHDFSDNYIQYTTKQ
ncbi:GDP-fucose synthetase [Mucilaginibacter sp. PPCGB 2223]|nr:GDP-L-fucose synthase [Mucilaginibacter sp. PPCGB 2223]OCX54567.1 GDP-fucose synthetase [Mucilaginibacter sp. PPCGB 2223]